MATAEIRPNRLQWYALALLVVSVCINYVDRGNLGVAAHSISEDLHFKPDQLGVLLGSVFWTYSLCQPIAGKIIDRWNVNVVFAIGFLAWSAATMATGWVSTFTAILLLRLILGAGESVAYPAYSKIIATNFPERLRGTANALIDAGSKVGPALGVLIGVKIVEEYSWRFMFIGIGGVSLLWLVPWTMVLPHLRARQRLEPVTWSPPYSQLIRNRAVWGTVVGLFGGNYMWYFFLTWLPYYFESERHYTKDRLAIFASLPFWVVAVSSMLFGLLADRLIDRGYPAGRVRQLFVASGLLCCCLFTLPAVLVREEWLSTLLLALACVGMAGFSSNHWALSQTLSGPAAAGKWTGFENCLGNFSGVVAPFISGLTLQKTHSFFLAFAISCCVCLMGAVGFLFIVGNPVEVEWDKPAALEPVARF